MILDVGGVVASYVPGSNVDAVWEKRLGLPSGSIGERVWGLPIRTAAEVGAVSIDEFWHEVAVVLSLDDSDARAFYEDCWAITYLDVRVASWLSSLRPRYRVATLSNSWSDGRRECIDRMNLDRLVDVMVFSAEEGVAKPDPEIYRRTLERLAVAPGEAVFIDDRLENVAAAQALGIHALHSGDPEHLLREAPALLAGLS